MVYVICVTHITTNTRFLKRFYEYDLAKKWLLHTIVFLLEKPPMEPLEIVDLFQNSSFDEIISVFSNEHLVISYMYIE
jgi:hypothetical protein